MFHDFLIVTKRPYLALRLKTSQVLVAALLGSLLMPITGIAAPQTLPIAAAAVSNGSIGLSSGGAGRISFATAIPTNQGLTWETWIKFTTIGAANSIFASCNNVASTDNCPTWFQEMHVYYLSSGKFRIQSIPGVNWCEATSSQSITANTWLHIALVIPAFTSGSNVTSTVYVGGRSAATCSGTANSNGPSFKGVVIGGSGNSSPANQFNIGPTRISKVARYSSQFTPQISYPTSGDANIWAVTNTPHDSDNAAACRVISDPNNKTLTFTTFATYQLNNFMTAPTNGTRGGEGTATVTCNVSSLVASDIATLSSASIKGVTPTLGTPNATLGSAVAGEATLTAAEAAGGLTTSFTRTDSGSTISRIVKYSSGASTANFETATTFANPSTDTISFGDFFIIKITAADGTTVNFYRINVTVIRSIQSATLSLDPGELAFRQAKELRATPSVAGKITFKANGQVIPGCKNKAVSASATVTCSYRPSTRGVVIISATLEPTSNSYIGATTSSNSIVGNRTGPRSR
jgi:hypothetical protein